MRSMWRNGRKIIRVTGTVLVGTGILLMLAGLCLFMRNRQEADLAEQRAREMLAKVKTAIESGTAFSGESGEDADGIYGNGSAADGGRETDMKAVMIDDYEYAGYLSIPSLGLELPVMAQWSYPRLKIAPCIYYGSASEGNLVIAAHNYAGHFGGLSKLEMGAEITYTDMEGTTWVYQVETTDVLAPEAVKEMTDAGYALTLFTCTYGGASRVTVRCEAVEKHNG